MIPRVSIGVGEPSRLVVSPTVSSQALGPATGEEIDNSPSPTQTSLGADPGAHCRRNARRHTLDDIRRQWDLAEAQVGC